MREGGDVETTLLKSDTVQPYGNVSTTIWSHKTSHKVWGGWSPEKTKGPEWK